MVHTIEYLIITMTQVHKRWFWENSKKLHNYYIFLVTNLESSGNIVHTNKAIKPHKACKLAYSLLCRGSLYLLDLGRCLNHITVKYYVNERNPLVPPPSCQGFGVLGFFSPSYFLVTFKSTSFLKNGYLETAQGVINSIWPKLDLGHCYIQIFNSSPGLAIGVVCILDFTRSIEVLAGWTWVSLSYISWACV